jgi:dihydroorotate dehydrogenase
LNAAETTLARFARLLNPETAHDAALSYLKIAPSGTLKPFPKSLAVDVAGLSFPSPIGLAAGFDKNAEVAGAMLARGFGFVEVGTITPKPQAGNPKPRLFRLLQDKALINRFGFNNHGMDVCLERLKARGRGVIGINVGANKDSENRIADYALGIAAFQPYADYFTANISSPNTPGLRSLQSKDALEQLATAVLEARAANEVRAGRKPPIFIKVAPDLQDEDIETIATVALASGIDGLIVSNTTLSRPVGTAVPHRSETGGLSGAPLFERSTIVLAKMRQALGPDMPLIGVGGVQTAEDVIAKMEAGANLVQLYTSMVYHGFGIAREIASELARLLDARDIASVVQLTNSSVEYWASRPVPQD